MRRLALCLSLSLGLGCEAEPRTPTTFGPPDDGVLAPFVQDHCLECHDRDLRFGDLALDDLLATSDFDDPAWRDVLAALRDERMPPPDAARLPSEAARAAAIVALDDLLDTSPADALPLAGPLRRLTHSEYDRTVRDLLGIHDAPSRHFPEDDAGHGFQRLGALSMSPLRWERYFEAAERLAERAILVFHPVSLEVPQLQGGSRRGRLRALNSNGSVSTTLFLPHDGRYRLSVELRADQAGPENARAAIRVAGLEVGQLEVLGEGDPTPYPLEIHVADLGPGGGEVSVEVAFVNDYYRPDDPDPGQRDRNLQVGALHLEGPLEVPEAPWAHRRWVTATPNADTDAAWNRAALAVLTPLAEAAYRRPPDSEDLKRLADLVVDARRAGDPFEQGLRAALTAILVSPNFLYHHESGAPTDGAHTLDEHDLAARLSYFLWSSSPEPWLVSGLRSAGTGAKYTQLVRRALRHTKASALSDDFARQWLQLGRLAESRPDPQRFGDVDDALLAAMAEESVAVFEAILREGRGVDDLVAGDFTFVDERLARHYGLPGVTGPRFQRVALPPERGGLTTHGAILTLTSDATRTSPVRRGKWILEVLLGAPPPAPPPGADQFAAGEPGDAATLRQRLERHRADPNCAVCHDRLDPLGFSLERFDAVGRRRLRDGDQPIDASGVLPSGESFEGAAGLREVLHQRVPEVARALTTKLFEYALGRPAQGRDHSEIRAVVRDAAPDYVVSDLILGITRTRAFRERGRAP